ncbi:hypothetical protein BDR26DRAFT_578641 [Obelidium mucronatum]|nr:hypothetical protein BDR26DRAFT_578641 [Obelidium mucronatum]
MQFFIQHLKKQFLLLISKRKTQIKNCTMTITNTCSRSSHTLVYKMRVVAIYQQLLASASTNSLTTRGIAAKVAADHHLSRSTLSKWIRSIQLIQADVKARGKGAVHLGWGNRMPGGGINPLTQRKPLIQQPKPLSQTLIDRDGIVSTAVFSPTMLQCRFPFMLQIKEITGLQFPSVTCGSGCILLLLLITQ